MRFEETFEVQQNREMGEGREIEGRRNMKRLLPEKRDGGEEKYEKRDGGEERERKASSPKIRASPPPLLLIIFPLTFHTISPTTALLRATL